MSILGERLMGDLELDVESGDVSPEWDEFVAAAPGGDIVQTTAWARFRRTQGFDSRRIVVRQDRRVVAGMQVLTRRAGPVTLAYVPFGPLGVTASDGLADRVFGILQSEFRHGAVFLQPPLGSEAVWERQRTGFRPSSVKVAPEASLRVDLSRPADELLMALSKSLRRNLRKSGERGVMIRLGSAADLPLLAELHAHTAHRQGFTPLSSRYLGDLWESLAPGGHVRLFVGEVEGDPVAAELLSTFAGVTTSRITGFSRSHEKARVPAATLWKAIEDARSRAERWFDFGGVSRRTAMRLLEGESLGESAAESFKLSFAPRPVLFPPAGEYVPGRLLRVGLAGARSFRPGRRLLKATADRLRQRPAA